MDHHRFSNDIIQAKTIRDHTKECFPACVQYRRQIACMLRMWIPGCIIVASCFCKPCAVTGFALMNMKTEEPSLRFRKSTDLCDYQHAITML